MTTSWKLVTKKKKKKKKKPILSLKWQVHGTAAAGPGTNTNSSRVRVPNRVPDQSFKKLQKKKRVRLIGINSRHGWSRKPHSQSDEAA
jgi:spermidine/putrescine-binding protein